MKDSRSGISLETMKTLLIISICFVSSVTACFAAGELARESPTATYLNQQWMEGRKNEIFDVASVRLARSSGDISSLSIKFYYYGEFLDVDGLRGILPELRRVIKKENIGEFARDMLTSDVDMTENILPQITDEVIKQERQKGFITGKSLAAYPTLIELEKRKMLPALTKTEQNYIE